MIPVLYTIIPFEQFLESAYVKDAQDVLSTKHTSRQVQ
jgi:hypothetical protein